MIGKIAIGKIVVAALCAALPCVAQPLHKCIDTQGRHSYQSESCGDGQRTVWVRDAPAATAHPTGSTPSPPVRAARTASAKRPRARASGAAISLHGDPRACERAREKRRKTYERLGLTRSFKTSRRMDDLVHQACR